MVWKPSVMTGLRCQLGWATVARDLVKHYSGSFFEGDFWVRLEFKSMDGEYSRKHSSNMGKALIEQQTDLEEEGLLPADALWTELYATPSWGLQSTDLPHQIFGLAKRPQLQEPIP